MAVDRAQALNCVHPLLDGVRLCMPDNAAEWELPIVAIT